MRYGSDEPAVTEEGGGKPSRVNLGAIPRGLLAIVALFGFLGCGKPDITWDCVMNGLGSGSCSFTNTGNAAGTVCGNVRVTRYRTQTSVESSVFCSGSVSQAATVKIDFEVPDVRDFCDAPNGGTWSSVCGLRFVDRKSREGETAVAQTPPSALPRQPQSLVLMGDDGSWSGSISPAAIVFRRGTRDSLVFEYKPPTVNGAISEYESVMTGMDTVRISILLALTRCNDNAGAEYTHMAQVWLTGERAGRKLEMESRGCAKEK